MSERRADLNTMAVEEHQRGLNNMHPHTAHKTHAPVTKPTCQHTVRRSPTRIPEYKWEATGSAQRERLKPPRIDFEMAQWGHNRPPRIHLSKNCKYA